MKFILAIGALVLAIWLLRVMWSRGAKQPSQRKISSTQREVSFRWPTLPNSGEASILRALEKGEEPPEDWLTGTWNARYQSVVGESFKNPNGTSRQAILRKARPGQRVFLVPEPTNEYDPDAVAVYLDTGGGSTAQIGYLPRDSALGADVKECAIAAWVAGVGKGGGGKLGASIYVAWDENNRS